MSRSLLNNLRKRLADVEYDIAKEKNLIYVLEDTIEICEKNKKYCEEKSLKWSLTAELGLQQAKLQVNIHLAHIAKFKNEAETLRLEIEEAVEALQKSSE